MSTLETVTHPAIRLYSATAYFGGKKGGHVAYGRTKAECERRANVGRDHAGTIVIALASTPTSADMVARLVAVGKLDSEPT